MAGLILVLLLIFWLLGYIQIPGFVFPNIVLFIINGHAISLLDLLIFVLILWAISIFPSPIRLILGIIFLLWVLSILGILTILNLPGFLVFLVIAVIVLFLLGII